MGIQIKLNSGLIKNVRHEIDLYSEFPWYENYTFNTELCGDALENDQRANYDDRLTNEDDKWVVDIFHKEVIKCLKIPLETC